MLSLDHWKDSGQSHILKKTVKTIMGKKLMIVKYLYLGQNSKAMENYTCHYNSTGS